MPLHKSLWLIIFTIFLFTVGIAHSQVIEGKKQVPPSSIPAKKWRVVDGFRSAKFGMNEKQVMQAIFKDFKASKDLVMRSKNSERTTRLALSIANLLLDGGIAQIIYTLGYKSKRLIQVDIVWGGNVDKQNVDYKLVMATASLIRGHLLKKKYRVKGFILDQRLKDGSIVIIRGQDKKGRLIFFSLRDLPAPAKEGVTLKLTYISDVKNPDIYTIK
jgi:hypothetical protein